MTALTKKNRAADLRMRRNYGITLEEYSKVLKYQKGACAICKRSASEFKTRLAIDHRHDSGQLCGLLCSVCNRALQAFRDSVMRLTAAAQYLESPPVSVVFGTHRYTAPGRVGTKKRAKLLKALGSNLTKEINV